MESSSMSIEISWLIGELRPERRQKLSDVPISSELVTISSSQNSSVLLKSKADNESWLICSSTMLFSLSKLDLACAFFTESCSLFLLLCRFRWWWWRLGFFLDLFVSLAESILFSLLPELTAGVSGVVSLASRSLLR